MLKYKMAEIVLYVLLILCLGFDQVIGALPKNYKPNPARDPNFDVSRGLGRKAEDCKRRLSKRVDEKARELQDELTGKRTARIGSPCNYGAWKSIRETFVFDEWNGNKQNFIRHLEVQINQIENGLLTLELLCIACEDEPLLECYLNSNANQAPDPDKPDGTCQCWRKYFRSNSTTVFEDSSHRVDVCQLDKGHRCRPASEVECRSGYYCDTDTLTCTCTEAKVEDCEQANIDGSMETVPVSKFCFIFCLVLLYYTRLCFKTTLLI